MTVTEMVDWFDLLQDKYGSPYFTTGEKEKFLNQAQLDIIHKLLPEDGDLKSVEQNANTWMIFNPLSFSITSAMTSAGVVTKASLEASLTTTLGFSTTILRPLSIWWTDADGTRPVAGPTRQNNWAKFMDNVFKKPIDKEPRYYETNSSYIVSPVNTGIILTINGLRYPRSISVSGAQGAELSSIAHNDIVARALEFAGVGSRDQMLVELQKVNNP